MGERIAGDGERRGTEGRRKRRKKMYAVTDKDVEGITRDTKKT
jgi:hypothetical protein